MSLDLGSLWLQDWRQDLREWRQHSPTTTDIKNLYDALVKNMSAMEKRIMAAVDELKVALDVQTALVTGFQRETQQIADLQAVQLQKIADLVAQLANQPDLSASVAQAQETNAKLSVALDALDAVSGTPDGPGAVGAARR